MRKIHILQQRLLSIGVDLFGPDGGRDFSRWFPDHDKLFGHAKTAVGTTSGIVANTRAILFLSLLFSFLLLSFDPQAYRESVLLLVKPSSRDRVGAPTHGRAYRRPPRVLPAYDGERGPRRPEISGATIKNLRPSTKLMGTPPEAAHTHLGHTDRSLPNRQKCDCAGRPRRKTANHTGELPCVIAGASPESAAASASRRHDVPSTTSDGPAATSNPNDGDGYPCGGADGPCPLAPSS